LWILIALKCASSSAESEKLNLLEPDLAHPR
jgi:hypothetical protein